MKMIFVNTVITGTKSKSYKKSWNASNFDTLIEFATNAMYGPSNNELKGRKIHLRNSHTFDKSFKILA